MSGRCFVRAAAAGVGRSAMYGEGSCQMSVRRRWDERVGGEGTGDEVGVVICRGEAVGAGRCCAVAAAAGSDGEEFVVAVLQCE